MSTIEARMKVKVLWLANWSAKEIAEFINMSLNDIENLIAVYRNGQR